MSFVRFTPHIRCPECGSSDVARSQRANELERFISRLVRFWPLRCLDCHNRWFVFSPHDPKTTLKAKLKRHD